MTITINIQLKLKLTNDTYLYERVVFALQSGRDQIRLNALEFIAKLTFYGKLNCKKRLYVFVSAIDVKKI